MKLTEINIPIKYTASVEAKIKAIDKKLFMYKMKGEEPIHNKNYVVLLLTSFKYKTLYTKDSIEMFKDYLESIGLKKENSYITTGHTFIRIITPSITEKMYVYPDGIKYRIAYVNGNTKVYDIYVYNKTGRIVAL